ncbi:uncharacterized protein F4807DRAFT_439385 [Annulohypoxylon truncatum]|uniref:uncharacterized protein n=1 Tax=Annulohypoxylon truncatum TaxID=327061 RepID=UPI002008B407|nr:uncharacterized protein F4807DRAFT_439385 [Annulohypoxylon truncatum]KAI1206508.1 hypothetical protein F4807DRAFT_439385 [Annulohypoxylon truncatum]
MCKDCYKTTAASVSMSLAMTNPELIWPYHQEQKRAARQASQAQPQPQSDVMSSSASTFSGSTAYSYDKEQGQNDTTTQKRSVRQRIKEAFKDMGSPPSAYHDRVNGQKTEEPAPEYGPMSSTPQSRT